MARTVSLESKVFASAGIKVNPDDDTSAGADLLTIPGGHIDAQGPYSSHVNFIENRQDALLNLIEKHGILPWSDLTAYEDGALCKVDRTFYQLVEGGDGTQDPSTDDGANWEEFTSGGGGSSFVDVQTEEITLALDQTEVSLTNASTSNMELYIEGAREFDFNVTGQKTFELPESFPAGTLIWVVSAEVYADAENIIVESTAGSSRTLKGWVDGQVYSYATLTDVFADTELKVGAYVQTAGYHEPLDGGANRYRCVATGTGTGDGGRLIDHPNSPIQLKGMFPGGIVRPEQFGAQHVPSPYYQADVDATPSASAAINAACLSSLVIGGKTVLAGAVYNCEEEVLFPENLHIEGVGSGRWNPTINLGIAGGAGRPDMAGSILLFTGDPTGTRNAIGVTDCRSGGGWVPNDEILEAGYDDYYKLTSFYNEDANTTTGAAATPIDLKVGVYCQQGSTSISASGLRIMCGYEGYEGYDKAFDGLGDPWDIGLFCDNTSECSFHDIKVVGYWRKAGRLLLSGLPETAGDIPSTSNEKVLFDHCVFTGWVGSAIRGLDYHRVISFDTDSITVPWADNHPFDVTLLGGRVRDSSGKTYTFTGVSKSGDELTLTGITPSPAANGLTTNKNIVPGTKAGGIGQLEDRSCTHGALDHQASVRATSPDLVGRIAKPSAAVECSGWRVRGYRAPGCKIMAHDDVAIHVHQSGDFYYGPEANGIESKTADGYGLGLRVIMSPAQASNTRVDHAAGETFAALIQAQEYIDNVDTRPLTPASPPRWPNSNGFFEGSGIADKSHMYRYKFHTDIRPQIGATAGLNAPDGSRRIWHDDVDGESSIRGTRVKILDDDGGDGVRLQGSGSGRSLYAFTGTFDVKSYNDSALYLGIRGGDGELLTNLNVIPGSDDSYSIGRSNRRVSAIYLATDPIVTSDVREKTEFVDLSDQERAVAVRVKGLVKKYKWLSAVKEKGEDARWHFGVGAQSVKEAFEAEGLDGFEYGCLCYDAWDASPAEFDEDGSEVKQAIEAGDRYGIRPSELLFFIMAAL